MSAGLAEAADWPAPPAVAGVVTLRTCHHQLDPNRRASIIQYNKQPYLEIVFF